MCQKTPAFVIDSSVDELVDNELTPLFIPQKSPEEELSEEEYRERFGPPYGPCGNLCDCAECLDFRQKWRLGKEEPVEEEEREEEVPIPEWIQKKAYDKAIQHYLKNEPVEEIREAVAESECFGIFWKDSEGIVCDMEECSIRGQCQSTFDLAHRILKEEISNQEEQELRQLAQEAEVAPPKEQPEFSDYLGVKSTSKTWDKLKDSAQGKETKWWETFSLSVARNIWKTLGCPEELKLKNFYHLMKKKGGAKVKKADRNEVFKDDYTKKFGKRLTRLVRTKHHTYFLVGERIFKIDISSSGSADLHMNKQLATKFAKAGGKLTKVTEKHVDAISTFLDRTGNNKPDYFKYKAKVTKENVASVLPIFKQAVIDLEELGYLQEEDLVNSCEAEKYYFSNPFIVEYISEMSEGSQDLFFLFADGKPHSIQNMKWYFIDDVVNKHDLLKHKFTENLNEHKIRTFLDIRAQVYAKNHLKKLVKDKWVDYLGDGHYKLSAVGEDRMNRVLHIFKDGSRVIYEIHKNRLKYEQERRKSIQTKIAATRRLIQDEELIEATEEYYVKKIFPKITLLQKREAYSPRPDYGKSRKKKA